MAKETEVTEQDLVDAFKWDEDGEGFFPAPTTKTKIEKEKELLDEVKNTEDGKTERVKKEAATEEEDGPGGDTKPEYEPFSENKHEKPEGESSESGKGESTEGKTTTKGSGVTKPEEHGTVGEPDDDKDFFKTLAQELKEKGIFSSIEIKEDEEITEEKFFELHEEEVQARADEIFEDIFEQLNQDPDAVAFIKFKKAGGSTYDFFNTYKNSSNLPDGLDLTKKASQLQVLKYYYTNVEKVDEEDLKEKLEFAEEKGEAYIEKYAKKYYKDINDKDVANKLAIIENQEKANKLATENAVKTRNKLQEVLEAGAGEGNFKFTKEEAKELIPYTTQASIKIGTNRFITNFQLELGVIMKDPKKMLTLAKIVKKKFDVPELTKATTTKVVNEVKSKLLEAKKTNKTRSTQASGEKSLADMFD